MGTNETAEFEKLQTALKSFRTYGINEYGMATNIAEFVRSELAALQRPAEVVPFGTRCPSCRGTLELSYVSGSDGMINCGNCKSRWEGKHHPPAPERAEPPTRESINEWLANARINGGWKAEADCVLAMLDRARKNALEEAAKECEGYILQPPHNGVRDEVAQTLADCIRALKGGAA